MTKNDVIQVPVSTELKAELERIGKEEEKSVAGVVRYAIKLYLKTKRKKFKIDLHPELPDDY